MDKYDLKLYLKNRFYFIPLVLIFFLLIHFSTGAIYNWYFYGFLFVIDIILGYFRYKNRLKYLADLEKKGLTEKVVNAREFIEHWRKN
jgi:hypothetical protein